jgi:RecA/RadA recombinase
MQAIGVDTNPSDTTYTYVDVDTIGQCKKVASQVIKGYKKEYGDEPDAPKLMIVIDSLDMLMTDTEMDHFDKGVTKGDQGQRNKQLKAMLREYVQAVKRPNITMLVTSQVYKNQDILNGEGVWIVSDAVKFSLSQITLLTKLKLKDKDTKNVTGIRMKCEGYKTRFTQPFQNVTIEVPYDTGMDPYNGLLDVAVDMGVCEKKGARYIVSGEETSWYAKDFGPRAQDVLVKCEANNHKFLDAMLDENELDTSAQTSTRKKRKEKFDDNNEA